MYPSSANGLIINMRILLTSIMKTEPPLLWITAALVLWVQWFRTQQPKHRHDTAHLAMFGPTVGLAQ